MDADWTDWNRAVFTPLSETDAELAQWLLARLGPTGWEPQFDEI